MTRWARGITHKEHDATKWEDMKGGSFKKNKQLYNSKKRSINDSVLEKKRAARRNRRKKAKPCFHCRKPGHQVADCPNKDGSLESSASDICFKCGSSEHTVHQCKAKVEEGEYPYATCFICKQKGHLSNKCPDNPRGLYPEGGGCRFCGSVEHYNKDCPERLKSKTSEGKSKKHRLKLMSTNQSADSLVFSDSDDEQPVLKKKIKKTHKTVKF